MGNSKALFAACTEDAGSALVVDTVGATVGTFASRMKRRLDEQKVEDVRAQKAASERHARILQSMTAIRKALHETTKINMGERFHLQLFVTDWEGWPKLDLRLVDHLAPTRIDYHLVVSVNDRRSQGWIGFSGRDNQLYGSLELASPTEVERLAPVLKKVARQFLDVVGNYVLNPCRPEELVEVAARAIEPAEDGQPDAIDSTLKDADIFSDDIDYGSDNIVKATSDTAPLPNNDLLKR